MNLRHSVRFGGIVLDLLPFLVLPFAADWLGLTGPKWPYWFAGYSLLFLAALFLIDLLIASRQSTSDH